MKNKQPLIFPVVLMYKGKFIQTKGIKCGYCDCQIIYKIVLPSSLSTVQLCWVIKERETWEIEFGVEMEPTLKTLLIDAVMNYDETKSIHPGFKLKSA